MDFVNCNDLTENILGNDRLAQYFKFKDKIFNKKDKGNLIWGCAMNRLRIPLAVARFGAHANDFFNACVQNPSFRDEANLHCAENEIPPYSKDAMIRIENCSRKIKLDDLPKIRRDAIMDGCIGKMHFKLDSPVDQAAIVEGYEYCANLK